ncbi:MAG: hypothetical protein AAFX76_02195, partial [Planctomycetota bacterium]
RAHPTGGSGTRRRGRIAARPAPGTAQNIVRSREADGAFLAPADLERVRMIGPVLRGRIAPWTLLPSPEPTDSVPGE